MRRANDATRVLKAGSPSIKLSVQPAYRSQEDARARLQTGGSIDMLLSLVIRDQIDRFSLAIDVIDRVSRLPIAGAHVEEKLRNMPIKPEIDQRTWL